MWICRCLLKVMYFEAQQKRSEGVAFCALFSYLFAGYSWDFTAFETFAAGSGW